MQKPPPPVDTVASFHRTYRGFSLPSPSLHSMTEAAIAMVMAMVVVVVTAQPPGQVRLRVRGLLRGWMTSGSGRGSGCVFPPACHLPHCGGIVPSTRTHTAFVFLLPFFHSFSFLLCPALLVSPLQLQLHFLLHQQQPLLYDDALSRVVVVVVGIQRGPPTGGRSVSVGLGRSHCGFPMCLSEGEV